MHCNCIQFLKGDVSRLFYTFFCAFEGLLHLWIGQQLLYMPRSFFSIFLRIDTLKTKQNDMKKKNETNSNSKERQLNESSNNHWYCACHSILKNTNIYTYRHKLIEMKRANQSNSDKNTHTLSHPIDYWRLNGIRILMFMIHSCWLLRVGYFFFRWNVNCIVDIAIFCSPCTN